MSEIDATVDEGFIVSGRGVVVAEWMAIRRSLDSPAVHIEVGKTNLRYSGSRDLPKLYGKGTAELINRRIDKMRKALCHYLPLGVQLSGYVNNRHQLICTDVRHWVQNGQLGRLSANAVNSQDAVALLNYLGIDRGELPDEVMELLRG